MLNPSFFSINYYMNSIIKDYELKLDVILEIIKENDSKGINSTKLNTIARCYKGFIRDLKHEALNIDSVSCCTHDDTVHQNIRCNVCKDCGYIVEIDV